MQPWWDFFKKKNYKLADPKLLNSNTSLSCTAVLPDIKAAQIICHDAFIKSFAFLYACILLEIKRSPLLSQSFTGNVPHYIHLTLDQMILPH